jgi:poly-gamma-glutamate synthesis protein (capsule biosynthesis protein)
MPEVCVAFVGDVSLAAPQGRAVDVRAELLDQAVLAGLKRAGAVVANLECLLQDDVEPEYYALRPLAMVAPTAAAAALHALGVRAVTVANNHIFDRGVEGIRGTLATLDSAGVAHFGVGLDYDRTAQPAVLELSGLRVALLGFAATGFPRRNRPGSFEFNSPQAHQLIAQARRGNDFVVAYFHDGIEATSYPMKSTIKDAHAAVEAGADLVVGTHPHTVQGIEYYRGVPIAYSLGNFIMPLSSAEHYAIWKPQTCLARLGIDFDLSIVEKAMILLARFQKGRPVQVEATPVRIAPDGLPRWSDDPSEDQAFIRRLSEAFSNPSDPAWARRDQIEKGYWGLLRRSIDWRAVLRRPYAIRWRHVRSLWRRLRN